MNDKKLVDKIIFLVRSHYQTLYTGYDTWIDRTNIIEHIGDITKESIKINGKIDAITDIANGEFK